MRSSQRQTALRRPLSRYRLLGLTLLLALSIAPLSSNSAGEAERQLFDKLGTMDWQVRPQASDNPAFCRQYLDDLKHQPERIGFIEPTVDTDTWTNPKLQELVGHCGRKNLLAGEFLREGVGTGRFAYYDDRIALWQLPSTDPQARATFFLLFRGTEYRLEPDPREYIPPAERDEYRRRYTGLGSYAILNAKTCEETKSFSIPGQYDGMQQGPRPVSYVRYRGGRFVHVNGRLSFSPDVFRIFIKRMNGAQISNFCSIVSDNLDEQGGEQ